MILGDKSLMALLPKMNIETGPGKAKFDPKIAIQPCSIDLRLDGIFWVPKRGKRQRPVDFTERIVGATQAKRYFRRKELRAGEYLTLKPGSMILARTLEKFTIPEGYAGKLEGRSTFARLGVSIHCTGDFINPGWRGRMPMQLMNNGPVPIRLMAQLPICQLIVTQLTEVSERPYGSMGLDSKYMDDEGEPSRYWKDQRIQALLESFRRANISDRARSELDKTMEDEDPGIVERFGWFLDRQRQESLDNADSILQRFADRERRAKKKDEVVKALFRWASFAPPFAVLAAQISYPPSVGILIVRLTLAALLCFASIYLGYVKDYPTKYYDRDI